MIIFPQESSIFVCLVSAVACVFFTCQAHASIHVLGMVLSRKVSHKEPIESAHKTAGCCATREHLAFGDIKRSVARAFLGGGKSKRGPTCSTSRAQKEKVKNRRRRVTRRPNMGWVSFIYLYTYNAAGDCHPAAFFGTMEYISYLQSCLFFNRPHTIL